MVKNTLKDKCNVENIFIKNIVKHLIQLNGKIIILKTIIAYVYGFV